MLAQNKEQYSFESFPACVPKAVIIHLRASVLSNSSPQMLSAVWQREEDKQGEREKQKTAMA